MNKIFLNFFKVDADMISNYLNIWTVLRSTIGYNEILNKIVGI